MNPDSFCEFVSSSGLLSDTDGLLLCHSAAQLLAALSQCCHLWQPLPPRIHSTHYSLLVRSELWRNGSEKSLQENW